MLSLLIDAWVTRNMSPVAKRRYYDKRYYEGLTKTTMAEALEAHEAWQDDVEGDMDWPQFCIWDENWGVIDLEDMQRSRIQGETVVECFVPLPNCEPGYVGSYALDMEVGIVA